MGYKKYSDEFKRDVLAMVAEGSRSVAQLERDLDRFSITCSQIVPCYYYSDTQKG